MRTVAMLLALLYSTSALAADDPADAASATPDAVVLEAGPVDAGKAITIKPVALPILVKADTPDAGPTVADPEPVKVEPVQPPATVTEALQTGGLLIEAAKNGNWTLFSGLVIMLLIFILDKLVKLKSIIPKDTVPWVASVFGICSSIAVQLTSGIPWGQALIQGAMAGMVAVGFWEMIFKKFLADKPAPVAPTEPSA